MSQPAVADGVFVYAGGNMTDRERSDDVQFSGSGLEIGVAGKFSMLELDLFGKRVHLEKGKDGDHLEFTDVMVGFGGRVSMHALNLKLGWATHDVTAKKDTETTHPLPDGKDSGLYYGAGVKAPVADTGAAIMLDVTRFQLEKSNYHIVEIMFGVEVPVFTFKGGGKS